MSIDTVAAEQEQREVDARYLERYANRKAKAAAEWLSEARANGIDSPDYHEVYLMQRAHIRAVRRLAREIRKGVTGIDTDTCPRCPEMVVGCAKRGARGHLLA